MKIFGNNSKFQIFTKSFFSENQVLNKTDVNVSNTAWSKFTDFVRENLPIWRWKTVDPTEFNYTKPLQKNENVFEEIKEFSNQNDSTFSKVAALLHDKKDFTHQFYFKYALKDAEQGAKFLKVMQIKAQEAHRFVPVIEDCKFIEPKPSGFTRQIFIKDGPKVQERVMIEPDAVIFIEESVTLPNGETLPGNFAAMNYVISEKGQHYFAGMYLYEDEPTEQKIRDRQAMFKQTYENMLDFTKNANVDQVYKQLKPLE